MTHHLRSEYLVQIGEHCLMDCCSFRLAWLKEQYPGEINIVGLVKVPEVPARHCGMDCVNWERMKK